MGSEDQKLFQSVNYLAEIYNCVVSSVTHNYRVPFLQQKQTMHSSFVVNTFSCFFEGARLPWGETKSIASLGLAIVRSDLTRVSGR